MFKTIEIKHVAILTVCFLLLFLFGISNCIKPPSLDVDGEYNLKVSLTDNGSVTWDPPRKHFESGSEVKLKAIPDEGWVFDGWMGDVKGSINPITVKMDEEKDITATFVRADTVKNEWLIMYYVDGDNNLEQYLYTDINEMESVYLPSVKVVALVDRIEGHWNGDGNWTDTRAFEIGYDAKGINSTLCKDTKRIAIPSLKVTDTGKSAELNMGNPQTLIKFVNFCKSKYGAKKTMLLFTNHGGGWRDKQNDRNFSPNPHSTKSTPLKSICWDDTNGKDYLEMKEIRQALNQTGSVDIVGMDACLMAMLEVGYDIRNSVDILVASAETEPGAGWPYNEIWTTLRGYSSFSAETFAKTIVNKYSGPTLSAIDLSQIADVQDAVESLGAEILDDNNCLPERVATLSYEYFENIELWDFCDRVTSKYPSAKDVKTAIDNAVIIHTENYSYSNHHGMAIYFPKAPDDYYAYPPSEYTSGNSSFVSDTPSWKELVDIGAKLSDEDKDKDRYETMNDSMMGAYSDSICHLFDGVEVSDTYILYEYDVDYWFMDTGEGADLSVTLYNPSNKNYDLLVYGIKADGTVDPVASSMTTKNPETAKYKDTYKEYWGYIMKVDSEKEHDFDKKNPYRIRAKLGQRIRVSCPVRASKLVTISVDTYDNKDITSVQFIVEDEEEKVILDKTDTEAPFSCEWDTTTTGDGKYFVTAYSYIGALLFYEDTIEVIVDNTLPTVDITSHEDGDVISGTETIKVDASDNIGLLKIEFSVRRNGEPSWTLIGNEDVSEEAITISTSFEMKTWEVEDGNYEIQMKVYDVANNFVETIVQVVINNSTPPTINIINPNEDDCIGGVRNIQTDIGESTGITKVDFLIRGEGIPSWNLIGSDLNGEDGYTYDWDTTSIDYHDYEIKTTIYNVIDKLSDDSIPVIVDNIPPTVNLIKPPNDGDLVKKTLTISANAEDNHGIKEVVFVVHYLGMTIVDEYADTEVPYTYEKDTTGWIDGVYYIDANAYDEAGNLTQDYITVIVDNTPPAIDITSHENNDYVRKTITIEADASDDNGVKMLMFYRNWDALPVGNPDTEAPYECDWDTTFWTDGNYEIEVVAFDNIMNDAVDTVALIVDNTNPTVNITSHSDGNRVGGDVTLSASANDNFEINYVSFSVTQSGSYITGGTISEPPYNFSWNTTSLAELDYVVEVVAYDKAGNNSTVDSVTLRVDNTRPEMEIIEPEDEDILSDTVAIVVNASDNEAVTRVLFHILKDGSSVLTHEDTSYDIGTYTYNWDTTAREDGNDYEIYVEVYDEAGNQRDNNFGVIVDNTPPELNITSHNDGDGVRDMVTIIADAIDYGTGVDYVEFYVDGSLKSTDSTSPYQYDWDTTSLSDGNYNIKVIAYDKAERSTTKSITLIVDYTNPTVSVPNVGIGGYVEGTVLIRVPASDTGSGIEKVEYYVDGAYKSTDSSSPYDYYWNTTILSDGAYDIKVIAYDKAGNQDDDERTLTVDNTSPTVSITDPDEGDTITSTVMIKVTASDSGIGLEKVKFFINGSVVSTDTTAPYQYSWGITENHYGNYEIKAIAYDYLGNSNNDTVNVFVPDTKDPDVDLKYPKNDYIYDGTVNIQVTASDSGSGMDYVAFIINGSEIGTDSSYPYSYSWNTTSEDDGAYTVLVRAYDNAGNTSTDHANISVDNTDPDVSITGPSGDVSGTVTISASASDYSGIFWVKFYVNGSLKTTDTSYPYSYSWNTNGYYGSTDIEVVAMDNATHTSSDSTTVNVLDKTKPTVSITSPSGTVSGTVTISASASDSGSGVNRVEFEVVDAWGMYEWTHTDYSASYTYSWDSTQIDDGEYVYITVYSYDNAGNSNYDYVSVMVDNGG